MNDALQRFIIRLVMTYVAPIAVMVAFVGKADLPDPWPGLIIGCFVWMAYWGLVARFTRDS